MGQVIVPAEMVERLRAAGRAVEVRDEAGRLVGRFEPHPSLDEVRQLVGPADWPSDEELRRLAQSDGPWFTPEQVMERLRGLTK